MSRKTGWRKWTKGHSPRSSTAGGGLAPILADTITYTLDPTGCSTPSPPNKTAEWLCLTIPNDLLPGYPNGTVWKTSGKKGNSPDFTETAAEYVYNGVGYVSFVTDSKGDDPYPVTKETITLTENANSGVFTFPNSPTTEPERLTPEPNSYVMLATGLLAMALVKRKRLADGIHQATRPQC